MIETGFRKTYQKICIDPLLRWLHRVHPLAVTCCACFTGMAIFPLLMFGFPLGAFVCLVLSGFLDTLDGSLARHLNLATSKGAALDIICDRIVEAAIILGLYAVEPSLRGLPVILMLSAILLCVTSFLIVGIFTPNDSAKSFHYSPGLIERAEAFIAFAAMIAFPSIFSYLAYLFAFLVFATAAIRMVQFWKSEC